MPRGQKKGEAREGKAAASKKNLIITEQAAEPIESGKYCICGPLVVCRNI